VVVEGDNVSPELADAAAATAADEAAGG